MRLGSSDELGLDFSGHVTSRGRVNPQESQTVSARERQFTPGNSRLSLFPFCPADPVTIDGEAWLFRRVPALRLRFSCAGARRFSRRNSSSSEVRRHSRLAAAMAFHDRDRQYRHPSAWTVTRHLGRRPLYDPAIVPPGSIALSPYIGQRCLAG